MAELAARALIGFLGALSFSLAAHATTIEFEVTDIADPVPGEDLYRYDYHVTDFDLPAGHGFRIFFPVADFGNLSDPITANSDWDPIAIDPDPLLPDAGFFDSLALTDNPSEAGLFSVTAVWTGGPGTRPGAQNFVVYDPSFAFIESGVTVSAIPEPTAATVFVLGFLVTGAAIALQGRSPKRRG